MKQKLPTLAIYIAIICFLLGLVALTETVITNTNSHSEAYQTNE